MRNFVQLYRTVVLCFVVTLFSVATAGAIELPAKTTIGWWFDHTLTWGSGQWDACHTHYADKKIGYACYQVSVDKVAKTHNISIEEAERKLQAELKVGDTIQLPYFVTTAKPRVTKLADFFGEAPQASADPQLIADDNGSEELLAFEEIETETKLNALEPVTAGEEKIAATLDLRQVTETAVLLPILKTKAVPEILPPPRPTEPRGNDSYITLLQVVIMLMSVAMIFGIISAAWKLLALKDDNTNLLRAEQGISAANDELRKENGRLKTENQALAHQTILQVNDELREEIQRLKEANARLLERSPVYLPGDSLPFKLDGHLYHVEVVSLSAKIEKGKLVYVPRVRVASLSEETFECNGPGDFARYMRARLGIEDTGGPAELVRLAA